MDITAIDRSAIGADSRLHRASAGAKLVALALVLLGAIASWNVLVLASLAIVLAAALAAARLDMRLAFGLAGYPALFAAVFAFASAPSVATGAVIVLKAVVAALAAVTVVLSTPYPQVFAQVQRIMPGLAGDALLMTYRTFFLLAERFGDMLRAVRLRSGTPRGRMAFVRSARTVSSALGSLALYAIELAERDYDVLYVRGYQGNLRAAPRRERCLADDVLVIVCALALAATAVIWRLGWSTLNPFSWLPLAAALVILAAAVLWRSVSGSHT